MGRKPLPADLPDWPRLMSRELAGAYTGLSPATLTGLPIVVVRVGSRVLYDRNDLDRWADALPRGGVAANSNGAVAGDPDDYWLNKLDDAC